MFFTLIAFFITLGIVIVFHEFGHYFTARLFGVRILRFSIGFGPVLKKFVDQHGTEWVISAFPLGGYVKMQEFPQSNAIKELLSSFSSQSVYRRFLIVLAGPFFNFSLAIILQIILSLFSFEQNIPILDEIPSNSAAYNVGFQKGDWIQSVDGKIVRTSTEAFSELKTAFSLGKSFTVLVKRAAYKNNQKIYIDRKDFEQYNFISERNIAQEFGLSFFKIRTAILFINKNDVAYNAGLKKGDVIISASSVTILDPETFIKIIQENMNKLLEVEVERDGKLYLFLLEPRICHLNGKNIGFIGIELGPKYGFKKTPYNLIFYEVFDSVLHIWNIATLYIKTLKEMILHISSWRNLGGLFSIAKQSAKTAQLGLHSYISYLVFFNVSLGILNLLPIPMLDGGYLFYYLVEILQRRPLSKKFISIAQSFGLIVLFLIMGIATFNDFLRYFWK